MKAVLQRVKSAKVKVDGKITGQIEQGFMILLGVEEGDTQKQADALALKISGLRIFTDENDKMNLSLADVGGNVLVVSNFTLCADCSHGRRPSFINAARPETAEPLYEYFCNQLLRNGVNKAEKGVFGADMLVSIENDGPVTLIIDSKDLIK
ncbi:MAG: D-aminoacyl-tRNA deacylase [bacterium]|nr:D-aminoacyl-tRNA deacylase [bacterium]MDD6225651.1 D-aminoacyl-tRNA deacylase [bacterium]MDY3861026.1 D-aminoacyl-tRNA deacylase [Ruminococcus sp.]